MKQETSAVRFAFTDVTWGLCAVMLAEQFFLGIFAPSTTQIVGMHLRTSAVTHYCSTLLQHVKQDGSFHVIESGQDDLTRMMSYREVCLCQKIFICV